MVAVRKDREMSLLTELCWMGAGFLQRCRAYGAGRTRFSFDSPPPVRFHQSMSAKTNAKATMHGILHFYWQ
jgi:hypothetical protein